METFEEMPQNPELLDEPKGIGAIDYISAMETSPPWEIANAERTMRNVKDFLHQCVSPLGYETGFHLQPGWVSPSEKVLKAAEKHGVSAYAGDIPYYKTPMQTLNDIVDSDNPIESAGYAAAQYLHPWLMESSITTMVNGIKPVGETKIIRACTEIVVNDQLPRILNHIKSLKEPIILALEINQKYQSPSEYLSIIRNMANEGLPVGISFDTAGMAKNEVVNETDVSAIRRWYQKILNDPKLLELLYCIEIDPISENGQRHAPLCSITGYTDGFMSDWSNTESAHNTPHFVLETDPRELKQFLQNPSHVRDILNRLSTS